MRASKRILGLAAIASLLLGLACHSSTSDNQGFVRYVQLSPDAGPVDEFLDGFPSIYSNLDFQDGTGDLNLVEGSYQIEIVPHGQNTSKSLVNFDLTVSQDTEQTIVSYDLVQSIKGMILLEDNSALPSGQMRFRAIHVAEAVGQVDIYNVTDANNPVLLYDDLTFGSAGSYVQLAAGTYDLGVDENGDQKVDLTFSLPDLQANSVTNIFFVNDDNGNEFLLLQFNDDLTSKINPD